MTVLRVLPLRVSIALGSGLGRIIGWCAIGDRGRMARRMGAALEAPPSIGACWSDLGRRFAEFACAARLTPRVEITAAARARFEAAAGRGRGVLVATLHLGNWELMAAALSAQGVDFAAVGARARPSPLHRWLGVERAALGVTVLAPGGGARAGAARLKDGGTMALFVDQATGERSRPIPFFHQLASTPTTYERLLTLSGATPLLVWSARDPDGVHRVHAEDVPAPSGVLDDQGGAVSTTGASKASPPRGARGTGSELDWLTARSEALIRAYPTQWIWLHPRWGDDG